MYLKSIEISNYRKFYSGIKVNKLDFLMLENDNNKFEFVKAESEYNAVDRTTLLVGQNNTGKTSLSEILLSISEKSSLEYGDINFDYFNEVYENIKLKKEEKTEILDSDLPIIGAILNIALDDERDDYVHILTSFIDIKKDASQTIKIKILWEVEDKAEILEQIKSRDITNKLNFTDIFINSKFTINFYNAVNSKVKLKSDDKLINVKIITANNL